ncbi:MAG: hypothetical protein ABJ388_17860 [Alphaproteobacteria bacterium]|jgi:hypothetical protein|uniref:hypothetical protein n=1 Tax=Roseibium sp. TaxID=1936156 RepID=UPI00327BA684|tara:strand:+ start:91 stop:528 length:438 start_codon:yes stop_codon:yes gene_type:complete
MRKLFPVTAALFGAVLLAGCASNSQEITKMGGLSIKVENTARTEIDMVKIWKREDGELILTGRIMQRGYGRLIRGHVDVEFIDNGTNAQRQYVGEIQRAIPITKHFKRANFDSNLGNLELAAGQLNLRYHEEAHQLEPMELKKNT